MNNLYSPPDLYYPRWLTTALQQASQDYPVVVLTGARQVGKSTLLLNAAPFREWRFHTLDDFGVLRQAYERPEELWAGTDRVVLDEVQKAPGLLLAVKQAVDRHPGRLRFALSGSANLLLMRQVSESLAGRAVYFVLHPMTLGEMQRAAPPNTLARALTGDWPEEGMLDASPPDPVEALLRGFLPPLLTLGSPQAWTRWWDGYVTTYLERDLRQLSQIDNLLDFRRLMEMLALRTGQVLNQSELGRDARVSQPTVHRYLNMLETTHLFERLPAYLANRTSRLLKSPKVFWNDPALAVFLSGYFETASLRQARELGAYFETMIFHHLRVLAGLMVPPARLYFWRTRSGTEVDFVVEHGRRLLAIEVKRAAQVNYGDAAALRAFLEEYPEASGGLLLYGGRAVRRLGEKIVALPWTMMTG
jgi:predicted AAA+ superfamily ATPase